MEGDRKLEPAGVYPHPLTSPVVCGISGTPPGQSFAAGWR